MLLVATVLFVDPLHRHLPTGVLSIARVLGRDWLVTLYFVLAGAAFLVYYLPRRVEHRPFALSAGAVGTVLASVLGLGTYLPCTTDGRWWSAVYHTMALFVGSVHEPFGGTESTCPTMPVSLEVARILALGVALAALVAVLMRLFVEQVDRLRVRFAHRIVLVTGLSESTEDLVLRLAQIYDGGPRIEEFKRHPNQRTRDMAARWLQDEFRQAAEVVVVEPNRGHPLIPRLRQAGVRVVTADPVTFSDLGRSRLGLSLLAAYLLDDDSTRNVEAAKALQSILGSESNRRDLVPVQIRVRVDNARDAEEFRRVSMSGMSRSVVVDTFGPQQVTCQQIATLAEKARPDVIILTGATPLATTLLDELVQAARERAAGGAHEQSVPVIVVGPGATSLVADHAYRQRWYDNSPLEVMDLEVPVDERGVLAAMELSGPAHSGHLDGEQDLEPGLRPFVVDCREGIESELLAHRCVQRWPSATALYQDPSVRGVEIDSGVRGLHRFWPALLLDGDLPDDRWMRAARIMHELYLTKYGIDENRAASQPWEVLSDFYRLSNLRALTHAMHLAGTMEGERQRIWRPVSDQQRPEPLTDLEYATVSRYEHADWKAYYEKGGWARSAQRDDARRMHPLLVPFDDEKSTPAILAEIAGRSESNVRDAFSLLEALGYRPYLRETIPNEAART